MSITAKGTALAALAAAAVVTGSLGLASPAVSDTDGVQVAATPTGAEPLVGTAVFRDAHGDMPHGADLWKVRVTNRTLVRVDITHDDLVRDHRSGSAGTVYLDTDPSTKGPDFAFVGGFFEGADYQLVRTDGWAPVDQAAPMSCRYRMTLDYAKDVTHVRIARGCLGRPEKVRVAVRVGGELAGGRVVRDWLHGPRELTRWVHHG